MIYGIDIGSTTKNVNWSLLKEKGIEFAVIKATQGDYRVNPNFPELAAAARQAGIATGLYHWCDPLRDGKAQGEYFLENTIRTEYDFAALDFEQYWADWNEWPGKIKKLLSPAKISKAGSITAATILNGSRSVSHIAAGKMKMLVYTRASFIHDYALPAIGWLADYPLWIAHWAYPSGRVTLTWEELLQKDAPCQMEPALPKGITRWTLHQWSGDRFILPGMNGEKVDLNSYNGSLAEFRTWLGLEQQTGDEDLLSALEAQIENFMLQAGELNHALQAYLFAQKARP